MSTVESCGGIVSVSMPGAFRMSTGFPSVESSAKVVRTVASFGALF